MVGESLVWVVGNTNVEFVRRVFNHIHKIHAKYSSPFDSSLHSLLRALNSLIRKNTSREVLGRALFTGGLPRASEASRVEMGGIDISSH